MPYGYGRGYPTSPWSAIGQGFAGGYLMRLQQQMQQQALMQRLALEQQMAEQKRRADLETELVTQGGHPALEAYQQGQFGGFKAMAEREAERKNQAAAVVEIAKQAGPDAAFRFSRGSAPLQPSVFPPVQAPGESEIGEIGHRYSVPIPGQTATVAPWEGLETIKQQGRLDEARYTQDLRADAEIEKERRVRQAMRDEAADSPEANAILAQMFPGTTPEQIAVLRQTVPNWKDLMATGRLAQGSEGLNLQQQLFELKKLIEAGGTAKSAAQIENTQANTGYTRERTRTETGTNRLGAARIENTIADIDTKYGRTAPQQSLMKERDARTDKTRAEIPFVGQKASSESDKRVATWVEHYKYGDEFADRPAKSGPLETFGIPWRSKPGRSRQELAEIDVKMTPPGVLQDIKRRAYQEAFGEGDTDPSPASRVPSRSTPTPTQPRSKTATDFLQKYGGQ